MVPRAKKRKPCGVHGSPRRPVCGSSQKFSVRTKRREVNWQLADMIGCKTLKSKAVPPDQGAGGSPARCYAEHTSKKGQHALELRLGPPPNL